MSGYVEWPEANDRRQTTLGAVLAIVPLLIWTRIVLRAFHSTPLVGGLVGGGVVVAAIFVPVLVWIHARRRRRRAVAAARAEGRPWWDADWSGDRKVARRSLLMRRVPYVLYFAAFLLGTALYSVLAIDAVASSTERIVWGAFGASLLVLLAAWVVFRGGAQVTFDRFPYLVGERATFFVATTEGSPQLRDARVLLRQVGPAYDLEGRIISKKVLITRWSRQVLIRPDTPPGPDEFIELTVDIPADLPGTALHDDPPVHWELLVHGRNRWGRVLETFRVPVYAAPAAVPTVVG